MDASPSEPELRSWAEAFRSLTGSERLAAIGALACGASMVLPWYRAPFVDAVKTGFSGFGFAEAALLVTVAAALLLLLEGGRGRRPPLPLHEGTLLVIAGAWAAIIVAFLMFDRPQFELGAFRRDYSLAYGIFVALGGSAAIVLAGVRIRRRELARERQ